MLTDRAPVDYLYLSRRLLTAIAHNDEGHRRRWWRSAGVNLKFLSVQWAPRPPDFDNLYELANRSVELVSDNTGDLNRWWAPYLHDRLEMKYGHFPAFQGWLGGEVACFAGDTTSEEGEKVFIALFGSASNLVGYRVGAEGVGFSPSTTEGLYALLDAVREQGDPEVSLDYLIDDHVLEERSRLDSVLMLSFGAARWGPVEVEFLARAFYPMTRYEGHYGTYDRVIVAAPLWVATPRPRSFSEASYDRQPRNRSGGTTSRPRRR